jgi:hypothetical protein
MTTTDHRVYFRVLLFCRDDVIQTANLPKSPFLFTLLALPALPALYSSLYPLSSYHFYVPPLHLRLPSLPLYPLLPSAPHSFSTPLCPSLPLFAHLP